MKLLPGGKGKNGSGSRGRAGGAAMSDEAARASWPTVARSLSAIPASADQLRAVSRAPGASDEPWDVLLQSLALDEHTALEALAQRSGLAYEPEPRLHDSAMPFYELVKPDFARSHQVAGLESDGRSMTVATSQPFQPSVFRLLEDALDMPVRLVLSPRAAVINVVNRGYEKRGDLVEEIVEDIPLDESALEAAAGQIGQSNDLLAMARQTPVIRLVNMILFEALRRRASDIHIHPMENRLSIRLRIDGMLEEAFSPPLSLAAAISSRLKVMTELDIANRHSPQDGQTTVRIGNRKIDIRLSVIPTIWGERVVLRLLDQSQTRLDLNDLGMSRRIQDELIDIVDRPNGMLLVTGPTGSGKTTTLYAVLGRVDRRSRNVMTIEDPVEYQLDGISQMQVNPKRNVTFATGLRSLLRQDPDVILVGEVRDRETGQLAIQASLTGHLVLATLHTNDAPSAIPRLVDIGVEPYLVTSSLLGVLAQRLLRRLDPVNSRPEAPVYRGRTAVHELMVMNDELRELTVRRADAVALRNAAMAAGFLDMKYDALEKKAKGVVDDSEIYRVLH